MNVNGFQNLQKHVSNFIRNSRKTACGPKGVDNISVAAATMMELHCKKEFHLVDKCCVEHDNCYNCGGKSQRQCDQKFKQCLIKASGNNQLCTSVGEMFSTAVEKFGKAFFKTNCEL
ncbi:unnamed protein product [Bursaphelenchus xylophilus]|uniref:(pine wood nematode) hypothetical protein n=1 Tax=Bursaphelenchus xylophilus TaxID=6326 RepID=A0A1I7SCR9_BURXY|nr:unnamed protein product [Bursaphelenchus xylophilus]CAG9093627.1 unnamed protein product [Bursaphelenchus xylophilus]